MTGHTEMASAGFALMLFLMEMMSLRVVNLLAMAAGTEGVILLMDDQAVQIMAVTAPHTVIVHLRLDIGAVDIDLFFDLAVNEIEILSEQGGNHLVENLSLFVIVVPKLITTGMTGGTKSDLLGRRGPRGGDWQSGVCRRRPAHLRKFSPGQML
jgi:hypothetical protein